MAHRLNTNKQFMIGNGILAFAVIFVVVIFVYMSMRLQQQKEGERSFIETYTITLAKGFAGDSTSIFINDSLLVDRTIAEEPFTIEVKRFAEQSALMIVDNATEKLSLFELSEKGGEYRFEKEGEEVKQLAKHESLPKTPFCISGARSSMPAPFHRSSGRAKPRSAPRDSSHGYVPVRAATRSLSDVWEGAPDNRTD